MSICPGYRLSASLTLVCAGPTRFARVGGFPGPDEPLEPAGRGKAGRRAERLAADRYCVSPALAARQTADALGMAASVDPALADIDHGRWTGCGFADIQAAEPGGLAAWIADPAAGAPEGESLTAARSRIGPWIDMTASIGGRTLAVTHPMMIRAALSHALGMPLSVTLSIDIAPWSRAMLSHNRLWRLRALIPSSDARATHV
ncbi:MAG: histidine phosphatase family protein [Sphingobium sp.]